MPCKQSDSTLLGEYCMNETKNIAHSVFEKLKSKSKIEKISLDYMLLRYAIERLLYRISISNFKSKFVLKGANLFYVWTGESARMTKDIDLLGNIVPNIDELHIIMKKICEMDTLFIDGLSFDQNNISIFEIRENQIYGGLRVNLVCSLHSAIIRIQVDIGFGDSIYPDFEMIEYPSILKMEKPLLQSYSRYTVVAEKFDAMIQLGIANSRMKDFFDIWYMTGLFDFKGQILQTAIKRTFSRRGTKIPSSIPLCFSDVFKNDAQKNTQWKAFINKSDMKIPVPDFHIVVYSVSEFITPVVNADQKGEEFNKNWYIGKGWI